jgi:NADH dehydrogenase
VIHLVAVRQGKEEKFQRVMVQGARDLVAASQKAGVRRFVLMSALGTSEENKDLLPYYRAKWDVEQLVAGSGIDHVIFRPSFIFGRDGGIIPTFRRLVKLAPVTPVIGSGERRIQPIWVDDMAAYFVQALEAAAATNRSFEIGGPEAVTWNEFWARYRRALGVRRRPTIHVPIGLMRVNALLTERLPGDLPLTRDLLTMLEHEDNVVTNDEAVQAFQLPLVPLDEQLRRLA